MKKLHLEREIFRTPQRMVGQEANGAILVVIEVLEGFWQRVVGSAVRRFGRFLRELTNVGRPELNIRRVRTARHLTNRSKRGYGDGRAEEIAAIQCNPIR